METGERARPDHLNDLLTAPETVHIFHAMRVIEAAWPDAPRMGESIRPKDDPVRLGQTPELAFPPSTIKEFKPPKDGKPGRMTNLMFGLWGPNGPLPLHLTEYARDRLRNHRDPTLVAFADMLTHRMMALLYRAWVSGQPAPSFDRPDRDPVERKVSAIAGLMGAGFRDRDAMPDLTKRHFAGFMAQGTKNAEGLVAMLSVFLRAKVRLQPFVGSWLDLEPDDRWQLGKRAPLGRATSLGSRVWSRAAKFRLLIGPLSLADYTRLLPGSDSLGRIEAVVRNYLGDTLAWDINVILRADEVPAAVLGRDTRLGQTAWLGARTGRGDAADLYLVPDSQRRGTGG
jgi:type VI secretion system protein ImpH